MRASSRLGYSLRLERRTELGEHRVQPTINVKTRRSPNHGADLLDPYPIFEPQREEELVRQIQVRNRLFQCVTSLGAKHARVGARGAAVFNTLEIELVGDEINQPAARRQPSTLRAFRLMAGLRSAILSAVVVHAKPARYHHQSGGKLSTPLTDERAQTAKPVISQLVQDERVVIHRLVVARRSPLRGREQQPAVLPEKRSPGAIARYGIRCLQERRELVGERWEQLGITDQSGVAVVSDEEATSQTRTAQRPKQPVGG